jgi:hypothetical protein
MDEVEEVHEAVFHRERVVVGVLLTADEHETIRREAAARGLNEAALIQEWVRERLGRT